MDNSNTKLRGLSTNMSLCHWIMYFLTNRPQHVRRGYTFSTTITLSTGVPQGCVLSTFLYSVFTHNCKPLHGTNHIKFADDITVIDFISTIDETAYRQEVQPQAPWCADNNLLLNTTTTKELILDFRGREEAHISPSTSTGGLWNASTASNSWGFYISKDPPWSINHQHLKPGQEGSPVPLFPEDTEETPPVLGYPGELLSRCD